MGEEIASQLWQSGADYHSPYARMIPGSQLAMPASSANVYIPQHRLREAGSIDSPSVCSRARALAHLLLPQPHAADRFALFQLVVADLLVLLAPCLLLSFGWPDWGLPPVVIPSYVVLVTLFGFSEGLYGNPAQEGPVELLAGLAKSPLFAIGLIFISSRYDTPLRAFLATFAASFSALAGWRYLRTLGLKSRRRRRDRETRKALIVGAGPVARAIAKALREDIGQPTEVCGFLDDHLPPSPEVQGRVGDLEWLARAEFIDEVIVALPNQPARAREAVAMAYRNHLDIRTVLDLPPGSWPNAGVDRIGGVPVLTLHRETLPCTKLFLKRVLDIAGAVTGLLLTGPLLAIIALLIWIDSPGPVIYSAERTGAKGRRFWCYKFRSMVADADQKKETLRSRNQREGPIFKLDDDPRITRVGRLLRRYSLDELPQLWNVLRGDMSLVGPRPHPVEEVNHYELHHYRRLDVKPGITGLWQITARKNPSFELNMHLDLTYIENWNLRLDLRILLRTLRVLFAPEGV